jgi:hypothetical protein
MSLLWHKADMPVALSNVCFRGNSGHIGDSGALPMTDEKRLFRKRRFQLGPGPPKKSPAEAGLKLQGQGCPLQGTKTLSRSPCVTIHSAVAPALTQRVVIERVGVDMPARWASNYESPLALLEYGGYCSGGAALNARRWRRRFVPQRHENGFHNQSPWFGRGDFPASSRAACRTTAPRDVMAITKRAYRPSLSRDYAFTRNDFCRMTIGALAVALGAFDAKHVELAFDIAEDEIGAGHGWPSVIAIPRKKLSTE